MCENVNINVSETNETINIVSSEIQEVIDINVFETTEDVTLNITEEIIQVNINKVTAAEQIQSDWNQTDVDELDFIKNKPTSTSDFINDGSDGVNPFITAADIPPVTGFVPYTGATANVDLGEYELKAGQVTLDTSPTGTAAVATTRWNDTIGSTETTLKGGSVVLKNGVDLVARVVNKVTPNTTLTKAAYQAVRISGAQGQRLAVAYAQANNDNNSADTIGIVCETIATNQEGFILTVGQLEEINTTGSLQGETWADGDVLYLSPTTAGRLTNIKPTGATGHIVVMGYVEYAHAIHGKIYVKIMNGWELDELHNVFINSPVNNQGLFYDSADSLWKNETIASALGYTPQQELVSGTNIKTINGSSVLGSGDLVVSGSSSLAIGTTPITSGTIGRVLFQGTGNVLQQSANLFWDNTNNRLGIGTATPTQALDILGTNVVVSKIRSSTNTGATIFQGFNDLNNSCEYGIIGSTRAGTGALASGNAYLYGGVDLAVTSLTNIKFGVGSILNERMRIFGATGNIVIQSGGTITDAGFRLDVNGTTRFQGISRFTVGGNNYIDINAGANASTPIIDFFYSGLVARRISIGGDTVGLNALNGFLLSSNGTIANAVPLTAGNINSTGGVASLSGLMYVFGTGDNIVQFGQRGLANRGVLGYAVNTNYLQIRTGGATSLSTGTLSTIFDNVGSVGIGGITSVNASAILQIDSTTKGFLPPRMTTTQKNAIATPAAGLMVYDTTLNLISVYNGTMWISL
jgi:nitrogen fixation protein